MAAEHPLKHPLQNCWAFWYYKNDKSKEWLENQKVITTFDTVEDFWAYVLYFLWRLRYMLNVYHMLICVYFCYEVALLLLC